MERLSCSATTSYQPVEAAIHIARYAPALAACTGKRVLDIACGEGYGSFLLAQAGAATVLGVDISPDAITAAEQQFRHPALRYLAADAETVQQSLGDQRYDLIISLETIEHLSNPVRFLEAIGRLRAERGSILISCPNDHSYYTADQSNPYHARKYHFEEFRNMAEQVLGPASGWFYGTPAIGFTTVPLAGLKPGHDGSDYARPLPMHAGFLCPPSSTDDVSVERSSYFFGAWGPAADSMLGSAHFPLSMVRYAALMWGNEEDTRQARQQLESERGQWHAAENTYAARLQALEQANASLRANLAQDRSLARVQLNALRKENDVLVESVANIGQREAECQATFARERAEMIRDRDFLIAERDRMIARLRPLWRLAEMVPQPARRAARRTAGWLLRLTRSRP